MIETKKYPTDFDDDTYIASRWLVVLSYHLFYNIISIVTPSQTLKMKFNMYFVPDP